MPVRVMICFLLGTEDYIHVRIQQRNGRRSLTIIQEIADELEKKELGKAFKKKSGCNGTAIGHPQYGEVTRVQDDQHKNTRERENGQVDNKWLRTTS